VRGPIEHILARGPLSRRILRAVTGSDKPEPGTAPDPQRVRAVYRTLCECLAAGRMFDA
jgi:hypothetical protein